MIDPAASSDNSVQIESLPALPAGVTLAEYNDIENVRLIVSAELDRGMISMGELLRLEIGDVLPFARPIGENIDLFAADVLIGNAEILAVNEKLAVRVADVRRKLTSSPAKKTLLITSNSGSASEIRKLSSNEL